MIKKHWKNVTPFLVATLTVTSLWAANAERLNPGQMWTPLVISLLVAGIFLLLFWLFRWTSKSAALVASFFTLGFLIWNEVTWIMGILMVLALVLGIWKRLHPIGEKLVLIIALMVAIAIPVNLIQGAVIHVKDQGKVEVSYPIIPDQPNIYFIVPDRMPSPAAMIESGIDSGNIIPGLENLGFYIPEDMVSLDPYTPDYEGQVFTTRTMRFFAEVLNGVDVPIDISYKEARSMIKQPRIFEVLHDQGYQITNVASWFNETASFPTADFNMRFQDVAFLEALFYDELSVAYFNRTMLAGLNFRVLQSDNSIVSVEQARHDWQFWALADMAASGRTSQFIMAHIMLPHEPFIYGSKSTEYQTLAQEPMEQYLDQIDYAINYLGTLALMIRMADPTAVIIVQSDEGMAFRKPPELNDNLSSVQWNGVFTAWYVPHNVGYMLGVEHTEILDVVVKLE